MKIFTVFVGVLLFVFSSVEAKIIVRKASGTKVLLKFSKSEKRNMRKGKIFSPVEDDSCKLKVLRVNQKKRLAQAKVISCDSRDSLFKGAQIVKSSMDRSSFDTGKSSVNEGFGSKKISYFASFSYSLATTGEISESQLEGSFNGDAALNLGGGLFYKANPKVFLGAAISYEMARTLSKLEVTKTSISGVATTNFDPKPSIALLNLELDMAYLMGNFYGLFGIVYPISIMTTEFTGSDQEFSGELGFTFGGGYILSPKFVIEGQYRLLNISYSATQFSGAQVQFWGLMLRGRYFF